MLSQECLDPKSMSFCLSFFGEIYDKLNAKCKVVLGGERPLQACHEVGSAPAPAPPQVSIARQEITADKNGRNQNRTKTHVLEIQAVSD